MGLNKINDTKTEYALKSDIEEIKSILMNRIDHSVEESKSKINHKVDDIKELAYQTGEDIKTRYYVGRDAVSNNVTEAQIRTEDAIRQRPIMSTAIAFGVGMLFAGIISRCGNSRDYR